jgi:hypothetical protein
VIRFIDDLMMKGDSSPSGLLTARGTSGAPVLASAGVARRFPETLLPLHLPRNTNGHPVRAPDGRDLHALGFVPPISSIMKRRAITVDRPAVTPIGRPTHGKHRGTEPTRGNVSSSGFHDRPQMGHGTNPRGAREAVESLCGY